MFVSLIACFQDNMTTTGTQLTNLQVLKDYHTDTLRIKGRGDTR